MARKNSKSPSSKGRRKGRYPAAKLNPAVVQGLARKTRAEQQRVPLVPLLELICKGEEDSIKTFFSKEGQDIPNREIIQQVLVRILQSLPDEVQAQGGNSVDFLPELPSAVRESRAARAQKLRDLQELRAKVTKLETDVNALREFTGLWVGQVPAHPVSFPKSEQVTTIASTFETVLDSMNAECNKILRLASSCRTESSRAREVHDRLYNSFNSLRMMAPAEGISTSSVPKDTRDLLRSMSRVMPK